MGLVLSPNTAPVGTDSPCNVLKYILKLIGTCRIQKLQFVLEPVPIPTLACSGTAVHRQHPGKMRALEKLA